MKHIAIVILTIALTSCQEIINIGAELMYEGDYSYIPLYYGDFYGIQSLEDIPRWMRSKVKYEVSDVQSPRETLDRGKGDCDCYALLYMNIAYILFDIKCDLGLVDKNNDGNIDHAVVILPSGKLINAQYGTEYNGSTDYEYDFDTVFKRR